MTSNKSPVYVLNSSVQTLRVCEKIHSLILSGHMAVSLLVDRGMFSQFRSLVADCDVFDVDAGVGHTVVFHC